MRRRRPNLADLMLERMTDGRAHDDAMVMLTASVEQVRLQVADAPWQSDLFLAQAEVLASDGDSVEALARCAAMALTLASTSATLIAALAEGLGYDVDGLLA